MTLDSVRVALRGVLANRRDALSQAMAQVNSILRRSHRIGHNQPPDFQVFNAASLLAAGKAAAKQFPLLLGVVAGISLLMGGIGSSASIRPAGPPP